MLQGVLYGTGINFNFFRILGSFYPFAGEQINGLTGAERALNGEIQLQGDVTVESPKSLPWFQCLIFLRGSDTER